MRYISLSGDRMVSNGPYLLQYSYAVCSSIPPHPHPTPSVWCIRNQSYLFIRSRTDEINCIVIGGKNLLTSKGMRGEEVYPRKLIIRLKWNEHTRGFSPSDQWSNLKEFMSESAGVWGHAVTLLYSCEPGGSKGRDRCSKLFILSQPLSWPPVQFRP